jgi:hypothetical protein
MGDQRFGLQCDEVPRVSLMMAHVGCPGHMNGVGPTRAIFESHAFSVKTNRYRVVRGCCHGYELHALSVKTNHLMRCPVAVATGY